MSALRQHAEDYLVLRRALGFKLERPGQLLMQFVEAAERAGASTVTTEVALAWATEPADADPAWWAARLAVVRAFARHLKAIEPWTEIPSPELLVARSRRADAYPYSDADVAAVMAAASATIPSPLRAATYRTLIGLLSVTGMFSGGPRRQATLRAACSQVSGGRRRSDERDRCSARIQRGPHFWGRGVLS